MKTVLYLSPYSTVPALYGGALRINSLCREVAHNYQVMHYAQQIQRNQITWSLSPLVQQVTTNYIEYSSRDPLSILLYGVSCSKLKCPPFLQSEVLGVTAPRWLHEQLRQAVVVNVEHPWQFAWVYRQVGKQKPIVVTAHNVELALCSAEQIAAPRPIARYLVQELERRERFAMQHASRIFTMSSEDSDDLVKRYNIPPERCVVIPNGVNCQAFVPSTPKLRQERKQPLGFANKFLVVFAGSTHGPNREAVQQIINWLDHWSDDQVHFLIVGSVGRAFSDINHPRITFTGQVNDTRPFFDAADIAINPMISGSGTNLKQVEYMAMGLPSLATPIGARGIGLVDGKHGYISNLENFPARLQWLIDHPEIYAQVGQNARLFVEQTFDWAVISSKIVEVYRELEAEPQLAMAQADI